jgi:hypothetical protein
MCCWCQNVLRRSGAAIRCGLLRYGGRADFVEGALGCSFAGVIVSGGSRLVEDNVVGEASSRAFSQRGGLGFRWADCWVGIEAQRVA